MDPARDGNEKNRKYRSYRVRLVALIITVLIVSAGFTVYYSIANQPSVQKTLTVYTYDTFMAYGANKTQAFDKVFGTFEKEYGVNIVVKTPQGGLLQTLEAQKGNPQANVVIGLTNINGIQAASGGLLMKYSPAATGYVNASLLRDMGNASSYLTPYEYSYLGIDYNRSFVNDGTFTPSFSDLLNSTYASNLLLENPTVSATGEGFLLWQIAYYQYVLHQNWTDWWAQLKQYTTGHIYDSWSTAFNYYGTATDSNLLVSYLTDPAYNDYFGYGNGTGSALSYHNGTAYGWRTVYCIGIVNGSSSTSLSEKFVNYFLSPTVQNEIPTNEWMYPANASIMLPPSYGAIESPVHIQALNDYMNAGTISENIQMWETVWLNVMQ